MIISSVITAAPAGLAAGTDVPGARAAAGGAAERAVAEQLVGTAIGGSPGSHCSAPGCTMPSPHMPHAVPSASTLGARHEAREPGAEKLLARRAALGSPVGSVAGLVPIAHAVATGHRGRDGGRRRAGVAVVGVVVGVVGVVGVAIGVDVVVITHVDLPGAVSVGFGREAARSCRSRSRWRRWPRVAAMDGNGSGDRFGFKPDPSCTASGAAIRGSR